MHTQKTLTYILKSMYKKKFRGRFTESTVFLNDFNSKLGIRRNTFFTLMTMLENKKISTYSIIETGCSRSGMKNISGDGASTYLFDAFLDHYNGDLLSIDIDIDAANHINSSTRHATCKCNDSIAELSITKQKIDCLYLDSLDVDFFDPRQSADHALNEFKAIEKQIDSETIICIDDTPKNHNYLPPWIDEPPKEFGKQVKDIAWPTGKGATLIPYLVSAGYRVVKHEYQAILIKP